MKRLTLMFLAMMMLSGLVFAQPYTFDIVNMDEDDWEFWPVLFNGVPIPHGNLGQIIKAGPDGIIQPPSSNGDVGGDDQLSYTFLIGDGWTYGEVSEYGMFAPTLTAFPVGQAPLPHLLTAGNEFYIRIWYSPSVTPDNPASVPVDPNSYYFTQGPWVVPSVGATVIWGIHPLNVWTPLNPGAPEIDVTPTSHNFGTLTVGNTADVTITVANTGTANLSVTNIQLVGAGFSLSGLPNFPATILPNGNIQFTATFAPTQAQVYNGTVTISSNDADEPTVNVNLTGTGEEIPVTPPEGNLSNPNPPNAPWNPVWGGHPQTGGLPAFEANFTGGPGVDNPTNLNFDLDDASNMHPAIAWDMGRLAQGYIGVMWVITPTGGTNFNATLTFRFLGAHLPGAPRVLAPTTPLYARGFNRTTLTWGYLFGNIPGEVTWTMDDRGNGDPLDDIYTVTVNGVTSFSDWFLSEDSELPVQMSSFNATAGDSRVNLSWVTESEVRNAYFKIERRVNGGAWTEIARVNSRANVSSATRLVYSYIDQNVVNGTTYEYRISDVSIDGVVSRYPRTVTATPRAEVINDYAITNYPNPFNPETKISFTLREAGAVKLTITNVMGQNVATLLNGEVMDRGTHNIVWNAGNLPSGIYLLRYEVNGFSTISKLVLSR